MRGGLVTLLVLLACIVVVVLYLLLGRSQLARTANDMQQRHDTLEAQLDEIQMKEAELPKLRARLPEWRRQLIMYRKAIPVALDDQVFFANITQELALRNVQVMGLETTLGGPWLGEIDEEMSQQLAAKGLNPEAVKATKVAFFSMTLLGDYKDILNAFESLKQYQRLYTIDMVAAPATGGEGTIAQVVDPGNTPLQLSGRLYFGLPEAEVSLVTLEKVFTRAVAAPAAEAAAGTSPEGTSAVKDSSPPAATAPVGRGK